VSQKSLYIDGNKNFQGGIITMDSTGRLIDLLHESSPDDLYILMEYLYGKNCQKVDVKTIVHDLRYNGSNNFAYFLRGFEGVEYLEIVRDVAKKMKVKVVPSETEEQVEAKLLVKVLEDFWKNASPEEKEKLKEIFEDVGDKNMDFSSGVFPGALVLSILGGKMAGFAAYKIALIVANAIARQVLGRGLNFAANAALTRGIGMFLGPIGWIVSSLLFAVDIAGPAYRKTIPAVLHIAYLRQKRKAALLGVNV
jgi:uncharacterized protein YaaW (UPF0174 family)